MTGYVHAVGVLVAIAVVVAAALVTGVGPAPGNSEQIEHFPTETPGEASGQAGGTGGDQAGDGQPDDGQSVDGRTNSNGSAAATPAGPPFEFDVNGIDECGETCRTVSTRLANEQATAAEDVDVYTRIFVGNGTDGDVVWQGTRSVGRLPANETVTAETTVELTVSDGHTVRDTGGWITVQTTVQSDEETMTVEKRRDVA